MAESHATHWVRITGDGIVYDGPCIVKTIIIEPGGDDRYTDVYDGHDPTSGTKFCRLRTATEHTRHINLSLGVLFGRGIYVDGQEDDVITTVTFVPL